MNVCCGECVFYKLRTNVDGVCHRYPPTVYPMPRQNVIGGKAQIDSLAMHPVVGFKEGCGEFIPKPKEEEPRPSEN